MKTKLMLSFSILFFLFLSLNSTAQTTVVLNPIADTYTTSSSSDNTNFGAEPYFKIGYNAANTRLKFNSFLKFRMTDELFANLAKVTSIEFGLYSDATGLATARQFKVSYIPLTPEANIWTESVMSGLFRSTMALTQPSFFTLTKADADPAMWYTYESTSTSHPSMFTALTSTFSANQEINFTMVPNSTFDAVLNPNQNDAIGVNFVSKDNTSFTSAYYPYLKFIYDGASAINDIKGSNLKISANSSGIRIQNIEESFDLAIYNLVGVEIHNIKNLNDGVISNLKLKSGIYIFKITVDKHEIMQKVNVGI